MKYDRVMTPNLPAAKSSADLPVLDLGKNKKAHDFFSIDSLDS